MNSPKSEVISISRACQRVNNLGKYNLASIIAGLMVIFVLTSGPAWSITIRHDRSDQQYRDIANQHMYGGIVNQSWGSATLISPTWILTAAHAISSGNFYTPGGNLWSAGGTHNIVQTVVHPNFSRTTTGWGYDIALARLSSPITHIDPVKLYSLDYGLEHHSPRRNDAIMLGFGYTGTGLTGAQLATNGVGRGAETTITGSWDSTRFYTQFTHPDNGARNLEGGIAGGDSGGAVLLNVNGEYVLAGVTSQRWGGSTSEGGDYGSGGVHIRSAIFNDWILQHATDATIIPEPTSILWMMGGMIFILFSRRRRMRTF